MSLFISSLNSGSNGNCYYVGNGEDAVLIDVGISCREVEKRMLRSGLTISTVKAIFISHEHSDHIRGVVVLARRYRIPVYITAPTLHRSVLLLEPELVRDFSAGPVQIGGLTVHPFRKFHDAADPYSFVVSGNGVNIGVFTDLGVVCAELIRHFRMCDAAFLESNYDEEMLETGRYPYYLKKRIRGGNGHLSNAQALDLVRRHKPPGMKHLLLSHLSKENNDPDLVHRMFLEHSGPTQVTVASRYEETAVFEISSAGIAAPPEPRRIVRPAAQMSLF